MAAPFVPWSVRRWATRAKHSPPGPTANWTEVVARTGRRHGFARYAPATSIQQLEFGCIDHALDPDDHPRQGAELPARGHVRRFYREMNFIVGASNGEETYFVVEWTAAGDVHGRPITRDELLEKGAQL